jgi:DNA methylase
LERRHLDRASRRRPLLAYIEQAPQQSTRAIAEKMGISQSMAAKAKQLSGFTHLPTKGINGKTYKPRPAATSAETINGASMAGHYLEDLAPGDHQCGITPRKLKKTVFEASRAKYAEGVAKPTPSYYRLHLGDFRTIASKIADEGVQVGLTDVPWGAHFDKLLLPCFQEYARILRPGALVASYTSPIQLPQMIKAGETVGLRVWWMICCINPESKTASHKKGFVQNLFRPVLIFAKPGAPVHQSQRWVLDVIQAPKEPRIYFEWQQPLAESLSILQGISRVGDLCVDLCAGSATTCFASIQLGRRWVGAEVTESTFRIASRRISHELKRRDKGDTVVPRLATAKV